MKKNTSTIADNKYYISLFFDNDEKYDCLCDVPDEERVYEEDCEDSIFNIGLKEANSMMLECDSKEKRDEFIEKIKDQTHILYAVGELKEE
jgi:hypothetical protein